jgi:tetratricopeptide (TPR) repeat protein
MLKEYQAPRVDPEEEQGFRPSRFDVAAVVGRQLDNLIASHEGALSAEYHFLAGDYDRVITLFEKRQLRSLSNQERDVYAWSRMMAGDRLHSAAKSQDDISLYRIAAQHFAVAAKIAVSEAAALYNWANVLFDLSFVMRHGAPEVMTRSGETLLLRAASKYRAAIAKDPNFSDAHNNLANALSDLSRGEDLRNDDSMLREAFVHYEAALRRTETPDVVHNNYAKALHDLARATNDLTLFKRSMAHFKSAARTNPNSFSVYLSWGHALADRARRTASVKDYYGAIEKYRRAAELDESVAAHHSWYYTLLEFANRSKGKRKAALLDQAKLVSNEQKRRRRLWQQKRDREKTQDSDSE